MKQLQGIITTIKTPNTVQVMVTRQWQHPMYGKSVKRTKRYACHFTDIELQEGNEVIIESCRPMSKTKRFRVLQKVEQVA
ncbi:MAG: 30S ribosomal protein S17 [Candidatus Pacebacteria bacterium RIFCSPHIGHO2_01_FULL_46_16]|nr:MAG: 30S ribosomal protein S17 [Candidatus Pacebacteria bacterium RIFCSPHIGHO2_01_FULL_46_16]OGJ22038.1 MAG: 30S ribosomal protein S17 [Candidatus Pacebacteria bacterium RIFCSPHIGHO2_02_FULL_46_9]OGJ38245.1 MAG: 30S ribosomal protein S17 [Candidatus Pacebacteria bacterium RIFCSPLOWO2_01_FULL_47_12]